MSAAIVANVAVDIAVPTAISVGLIATPVGWAAVGVAVALILVSGIVG